MKFNKITYALYKKVKYSITKILEKISKTQEKI